nr:hypothetical protein [Tanacetum cinerariifolium]
MNQLCKDRGIKREFSVARTPQQNEVAERINKTLIEAVRTMALMTKLHNKTPYELIRGRLPLIDFMKPFGCPVTILNTKDNLGKFEGKADEGYFVGKWTRLFDIDSLTISMNYVPVVVGNQTNGIAGSKENLAASQDDKKKELEQEYILIPICTTDLLISQGTKDSAVDAEKKAPKVDESEASDNGGKNDQVLRSEVESLIQQERQTENINSFNIVSSSVNTVGSSFVNAALQTNQYCWTFLLEKEVDMNNVDSSYTIPEATKFLKDHSQEQVIGSLETPVQTRQMSKTHKEFGLLSSVHKLRRTNHKDFQNCLFACFLSQMEPEKPVQALQDPSWVEAMQDELLQNKKNERGTLIKNKARLVTQGHTQEEGIDYDEVFAPVARIEAIRLFLAYASFKYFVVYQMDIKSAFLYGRIEERLRFVLDCVLSWIAFCLSEDHLLHFAKDKLCQTQNCVAFCLQEDCVLSSRRLRFVFKKIAFCLQDLAFCLQEDLAFCLGSIAFCLSQGLHFV